MRTGLLKYLFETCVLDYGNRSLNNTLKKGFARGINALISESGINTGRVGFATWDEWDL